MTNTTTYTFTVRGPSPELGIWNGDHDVTEFVTGAYDAPVTRAEIEELIATPGCNSPVTWGDGLIGWYNENTLDEDDEYVTLEFTITLTPVVLGVAFSAPWNTDHRLVACADCVGGFFHDGPDGSIVNEDGDVVAGAEWITDPADLHAGEQCETCGGVSTTVWTGSKWKTVTA